MRERRRRMKPMDVPITDPEFFAKLGSRGGTSTRDKHGADYFRKIAVLSHQIRREKAAEAAEKAKLRAASRNGR